MTTVYLVSYNIDGNNPSTYFADVDNPIFVEKDKSPIMLNKVLTKMFKQFIMNELHNPRNCELEGRCKLCLGYDNDDKLFDSINILSYHKID